MDTNSNMMQPVNLPYQVDANFEDEDPDAENDNTGILGGIEAKEKKPSS